MEKEVNKQDIEVIVDNMNGDDVNAAEAAVKTEAPAQPVSAPVVGDTPTSFKAYVPRFTEVSERYRMKGDARIRERFGIKTVAVAQYDDPDELKLDPTADFDEDVMSAAIKEPERRAEDDSDESISVMKFAAEENSDETPEEKQAREEIENLLKVEPRPESKPEPRFESVPDFTVEVGEEEEAEEPEVEATTEEPAVEAVETEEPQVIEIITDSQPEEMADPDEDDMGVVDYPAESNEDEDAPEGASDAIAPQTGKVKESQEYTNPANRDSFKDKFLDSLIAIKIRLGASLVFAFALLIIEFLAATRSVTYQLIAGSTSYATLGLIDFMLASSIFVMCLPEIVRSFKYLFNKNLMPDILPVPAFLVLGGYTLTIFLTEATAYPLFGLLFATVTIPVMTAALYRTKADFLAFKLISQTEDKHIIDKKNTRELPAENMALDGIVDEYKSKIARTFKTSFVSDFFKNSAGVPVTTKHVGFIFGLPFGVALVAAVAAYFLSALNPVTAVATFALTVMLGCPAFAIVASKVGFFYTQKSALLSDSTAIGEDAYLNFSSVDVFAFDDNDIFGPDDVNLKRFMLYGERDSMEKVMRQMCALFASVGGPLDYMFSNAIDNRVRHKSATNMIIEDDGICGEVAGHRICAGSEEYMRRNGIAIPSAAVSADSSTGLDTTKVMYAAEDGEVYAKFYIRYSFSEEFTMILSSLREAGITPLVYSRDPNISAELLDTLTTGNGFMRVVKLYNPLGEEKVYGRVSANMVTYGDKLDAAGMILLSKKYKSFSDRVRFAEVCGMAVGTILALVLCILGFANPRIVGVISALWQVALCVGLKFLSKTVFFTDAKKKEETEEE